METMIDLLMNNGTAIVVLGYMLMINKKMQEKLFLIIETNTKAMTDLKNVIENMKG